MTSNHSNVDTSAKVVPGLRNTRGAVSLWLIILLSIGYGAAVLGQSTAFTYQGRLNSNGTPVTGLYDLSFQLFNSESSGSPVGNTVTATGVAVTRGLFVLPLDFGQASFNGEARWLQIAARTNGGTGGFATLVPRQPISAAPYSIY